MRMLLRKRWSKIEAFALMELMITVGILALVLIGLIQLFFHCLSLGEIAGNLTLAICEAQGKLEEIRNHSFDSMVADYGENGNPGHTFNPGQLDGKGLICINDTNPELLEIEIVVSWRGKGNRIVGEDKNLNGTLDANEDNNKNGKLDSPASLVSMIAKR